MSLTVEQNVCTRIWEDVGSKIVSTLQKAGIQTDAEALAIEIFERIWPDIFKEIKGQVEVTEDMLLNMTEIVLLRRKKH
jgi:hypothetical protein